MIFHNLEDHPVAVFNIRVKRRDTRALPAVGLSTATLLTFGKLLFRDAVTGRQDVCGASHGEIQPTRKRVVAMRRDDLGRRENSHARCRGRTSQVERVNVGAEKKERLSHQRNRKRKRQDRRRGDHAVGVANQIFGQDDVGIT